DEIARVQLVGLIAVDLQRIPRSPGDDRVAPDLGEREVAEIVDPANPLEHDLVRVAEVGDAVIAATILDHETIVVLVAGHDVVAATAVERVIALAADQRVVARSGTRT